QFCELHALRLISNGFLVRPPRSSDPPAKVIEGRLRYLGFEGPYRTVFALSVTWAGKEQKTKGQCGYRFVERHGSFTASGGGERCNPLPSPILRGTGRPGEDDEHCGGNCSRQHAF